MRARLGVKPSFLNLNQVFAAVDGKLRRRYRRSALAARSTHAFSREPSLKRGVCLVKRGAFADESP